MNTDQRFKRYREMALGREVSLEDIQRILNHGSENPCVLDVNRNRLFYLDDFFNKLGPETLYWRDVSALELPSGHGVLYRGFGSENGQNSFYGFFERLLDNLVARNLMSKSKYPDEITPGDYLIDGRGIGVRRFPEERDSMGNPMCNFYYPKLEADAFEYAGAFCSGFATISRAVKRISCS